MADSLLITGPPASGKSRGAMDRFHAMADSLLLVPTATMAEHVRNELARAGFAVRPSRVMTLAGFLEWRAPAAASKYLVHFTIENTLERLRPARFAGVAEYRGFREGIVKLMEEAPVDAIGGDLGEVLREVENSLGARGSATRNRRIAEAAKNPGALPEHIAFDGFFSFSSAELELVAALASRAKLTVTLPDWPESANARRRLLAEGFREERCGTIRRRAETSAFAALTLEREIEEIARRILDEAARGRPFREIGIIVRVREPYGAALETALARFGIPARFYFADALMAHPAIAYFAAIVQAALSGWDYEALVRIAGMPVSGLGATREGDHFAHELRKRLPGAGLPLRWSGEAPALMHALLELDPWRREKLDPRQWADRLGSLRALLPEQTVDDSISRDALRSAQSTAAALEAFDAALAEVADALEDAPLTLADYWTRVEAALAIETLRVPDRRRNVVHVLDVFEARQWELPVVFVCGLVEGHFPRYHHEDPLLGDAARRRAGLRTSGDLQDQERQLFELASSRATEKTILSYARFNEKGEEAVPSFFLTGRRVEFCDARVRPRPAHRAPAAGAAAIQDEALLANLARTHKALAPTSIESFLQCPFQFFAAKTLRLRARPKRPRERLDVLLQGSILHRALAEYSRAPLLGVTVFDEVFAEECALAGVPATYRTEAVRLEMRRNFENFLRDGQAVTGWSSRVEEEFSFPLNPLLTLRGRIDRIDIGPQKQALVIDYKYSAGNKIRERADEDTGGNLVQGGLYLLAAEKQFGWKAAGMLYCGLRKTIEWGGWHVSIRGLEGTGEAVTRGVLEEMMKAAAAKAMASFEAICSGKIAPAPADEKKCAWCDFADICRVESMGAAKKAGA